MRKVRNAVIIIILCIIGASVVKKNPPVLLLVRDAVGEIRDSLAGRRIPPPLRNEGLFSVQDVKPRGTSNTLGDIPPPPRGNGGGGFIAPPNNPGQPPVLSPSGPGE